MHLPASLEQMLRLDGRDFVRTAYLMLLGREPDPAGLHHYLGLLTVQGGKRQAVASIAGSRERKEALARALAHPDDAAFVRSAYLLLLGREPDPQGFEHHIQALRQGLARSQLIENLRNSQESRDRQAVIAGFEAELEALVAEGGGFLRRLRCLLQARLLQASLRLVAGLRQVLVRHPGLERRVQRWLGQHPRQQQRILGLLRRLERTQDRTSAPGEPAAGSDTARCVHELSPHARRILLRMRLQMRH
ncbi:MAG: hypothetical protein KatS3mg122_3312 [Caldimonas sp.]|nr:MAG: hypothetical protein KatS3mg122_3312 [Caldimonas sp.]